MATLSENEQLERVFLKLGLSETDEQLESILLRFLQPVLLKLGSSDAAIRTKVLELLTHVNKRLKARDKVQLPVEQLIKQFNDTTLTSFVTNFTIIYIKTGYPRLDVEKRIELIPLLFMSLENKAKSQQDIILRLLLENFPHLKFDDNLTLTEKFHFSSHKNATTVLLDYMLDAILMPYSVSLGEISSASVRPSTAPPTSSTANHPGLSTNAVRRLVGDSAWPLDVVERIKVSILRFIKAACVETNRVVPHLVVACSDSRHTVATTADLELRKHSSTIDWNSASLVSKLYRICLGQALSKKSTPVGDRRQPANIRMKLKLILYLLRSKAAAESFPFTIQLVYDGLFAANNAKVKALALQFVQHIFDKADHSKLQNQAVLLLDALLKVVGNEETDTKSKCLAYISMGKLANRMPDLFTQRFNILLGMFESLPREESVEVKLSMHEALIMMTAAYKNLPSDKLDGVAMLIDKAMEDSDQYLRLVGVQYAGSIFPSTHVQSKYQLLLATGDAKEEVVASAESFLYGKRKDSPLVRKELDFKLPNFSDILTHVYKHAVERSTSSKRHVIGTRSIPFLPTTFKSILVYVRKCLIGQTPLNPFDVNDLDPDDLQRTSQHIAAHLRQKLLGNDTEMIKLVSMYVDLLYQYLRLISDPSIVYYLLEIIASCPENVEARKILVCNESPKSEEISVKIAWIKSLTTHTRENIRQYGAELYSIVFKRTSSIAKDYLPLIKDSVHLASSKKFEEKHGNLLLLGYVVGNYLKVADKDDVAVAKEAITTLVKNVQTQQDQLFVGAACFALGEISRKVGLPLDDGQKKNDEEDNKTTNREDNTVSETKLSVVEALTSLLTSKTAHKLRENVVIALGRVPVGDWDFPHIDLIIKTLLDSSEIKDTELHFSVGRALCSAALGGKSPERFDRWHNRENPFYRLQRPEDESRDRPDHVEELLSKIIREYVVHRIPAARQASCVWLMMMLKTEECSKHPAVTSHLMDLQKSFTSLLAEPDDLTQDIASKGFGIVYELGSDEQKKILVDQLVESLTGGSETNSPASKVRILGQEGNALFQSSVQLGKAPDGSSLTTYKELCSLASDLNQPDLVYKFLHLANHHAMWNTKKGVAFGFRTIAEAAQEQLQPHLPRMVPRLYRYTFDPQPSVRNAMTSIWNVVAPEPSKTVERFMAEILNDLIFNLTHKLWRTRQASCHALTDLLRSGFKRPESNVVGQSEGGATSPASIITGRLAELWSIVFRVSDDVKETVRNAAEDTCKVLKKITVKLFDKESTWINADEEVVSRILQVLLKDGMENTMKDIQAMSLSTLIEVSKVCGSLIKPCIPQMVIALLEAMSGLEAPVLNYFHNRSAHVTQDALDWVRAEAVKSSPLMETATRCLRQYDETVLKSLAPPLADLTKRGIGLSTKAGCAHLITSLVTSCGNDLTPFAGKFINALTSGLADRSLAVRKVNSTAIGHLSRVAKDATLEKTLLKMKSWYLEKEEEYSKHASASVFYAIARHCPDTLNRHAALVLPLAFYGMHEKQPQKRGKAPSSQQSNSMTEGDDVNFALTSREMWEAIWNEFTPGSETAVRLHLKEIVEISSGALRSSSWASKAQAAASMATVAKKQRPGTVVRPHLDNLLVALTEGLQGRTWEGKESLLDALSNVCKHCGDEMSEGELEKTIAVLTKECKREKVVYSVEAISCLAEVLESRKLNRFEHFWPLARPHLVKTGDGSDSDDDGNATNRKERKTAVLKRQEQVLKAVKKAWSYTGETQESTLTDVLSILSEFAELSTFAVQISALKCLTAILCSLKQSEKSDYPEALVLVKPVSSCLTNMKFSAIRDEAVNASEHLVDLICEKRCPIPPDDFRTFVNALQETSEKTEHVDLVRILLSKCESVFESM